MARNPNDPFDPSNPQTESQQQPNQNGGLMPPSTQNGPSNGTFNMGDYSPSSPFPNPTRRGGSFTVNAPSSGGWDYGWDFGAHNGQSFSYDNPAEGAKYAFAKYVQDNNLDPNTADAASIAAGLNQLYGGNVFSANGDRRVSYGDEFVDWSGQGKPAGQWFWGSNGGGGGGIGSGSGVIGIGTGTGTSGTGHSANTAISAAIQQMLSQGQEPVTAESVAGQYLPVRNAMERQAQIANEQAAQANAAQGGPQGGGVMDAQRASAAENLGSSEGQLMAGLMTQELQRRRQMVVDAISASQGEERLRLQALLQEYNRQIQQAQVGLQQQQITNQNTQWWNQFGLNSALQNYLLNSNFQQNLAGQ